MDGSGLAAEWDKSQTQGDVHCWSLRHGWLKVTIGKTGSIEMPYHFGTWYRATSSECPCITLGLRMRCDEPRPLRAPTEASTPDRYLLLDTCTQCILCRTAGRPSCITNRNTMLSTWRSNLVHKYQLIKYFDDREAETFRHGASKVLGKGQGCGKEAKS